MANAATLPEVLSSAMVTVDSIQSYEFRCRLLDSGTLSLGKTKQLWFRQSGDFFRMEMEFDPLTRGDEDQLVELTSAYNGTIFQQFYPHNSTLTFTAESRFINPYVELNPLTAPYFWLLDLPFQNWAAMRSPEAWNKIANIAHLEPREMVGSHECDVLVIPYPRAGVGAELRVFLAVEAGYYPIRTRLLPSRDRPLERLELDVSSFERMRVEGRSFTIPTHITFLEYDAKGEVDNNLTWDIDSESIKINCDFPNDIFTLSPSMAKVVDDYDYNTKHLYDEGLMPIDKAIKPRSMSKWLIANIIAVIALFLAIAYRWKARRHSKR